MIITIARKCGCDADSIGRAVAVTNPATEHGTEPQIHADSPALPSR